MEIASKIAERATCPRKHVGAVIVKDKTILATGYNGSLSSLPHCEDSSCIIENNHCVRTIHAEVNAIAQAAKNGVSVSGANLYITAFPCWGCFKTLINAGIINIYYAEEYGVDSKVEEAVNCLQRTGKDITLNFVNNDKETYE